jgi:hypothetical protein
LTYFENEQVGRQELFTIHLKEVVFKFLITYIYGFQLKVNDCNKFNKNGHVKSQIKTML